MSTFIEQFKNKNISELDNYFIEACTNGNLEVVQHLLTHENYNTISQNTSLFNKSYGLDKAAVYGHLDVVKHLLNNSDLKNDSDLPEYLNSAFQYGCIHGHFAIVEYLLTSEDLSIKPNIHADEDDALFYACSHGYLDIIKFLLESPKIKEHSQILPRCLPSAAIGGHLNVIKYFLTVSNSRIKDKTYPTIDEAFYDACQSGQLDVVKYLIESKDLNFNANLHYNKDGAFDIALRNHKVNILEYFILDLNIERTIDIENCLKRASENFSSLIANKLFNFRELKKEVSEEINNNNTNNKILKI